MRLLLFVILALISSFASSAEVSSDWTRLIEGDGMDTSSVVDAVSYGDKLYVLADVSYIQGESSQFGTQVRAYSTSGTLLWTYQVVDPYGLPERGSRIGISQDGKVLAITALVETPSTVQLAVIRLSPTTGARVWQRGLAPVEDAKALVVTNDRIVVGSTIRSAQNLFTAQIQAYAASGGTPLARNVWNRGFFTPTRLIDVHHDGTETYALINHDGRNVALVRYDALMNEDWSQILDGNCIPYGLTKMPSGDVYTMSRVPEDHILRVHRVSRSGFVRWMSDYRRGTTENPTKIFPHGDRVLVAGSSYDFAEALAGVVGWKESSSYPTIQSFFEKDGLQYAMADAISVPGGVLMAIEQSQNEDKRYSPNGTIRKVMTTKWDNGVRRFTHILDVETNLRRIVEFPGGFVILGDQPGSARGRIQRYLVKPTVSFNLSPATVIGGYPSTGTVTLDDNAPRGGITLKVAGSGWSVHPQTVTIPEGEKSVQFEIGTKHPYSALSETITIGEGDGAVSKSLQINVIEVSSISVTPQILYGGEAISVKIDLTHTPALPINVAVVDYQPYGLPSIVQFPPGTKSVTLNGTAPLTSVLKTFTLRARRKDLKSTTFQVRAPIIVSAATTEVGRVDSTVPLLVKTRGKGNTVQTLSFAATSAGWSGQTTSIPAGATERVINVKTSPSAAIGQTVTGSVKLGSQVVPVTAKITQLGAITLTITPNVGTATTTVNTRISLKKPAPVDATVQITGALNRQVKILKGQQVANLSAAAGAGPMGKTKATASYGGVDSGSADFTRQ